MISSSAVAQRGRERFMGDGAMRMHERQKTSLALSLSFVALNRCSQPLSLSLSLSLPSFFFPFFPGPGLAARPADQGRAPLQAQAQGQAALGRVGAQVRHGDARGGGRKRKWRRKRRWQLADLAVVLFRSPDDDLRGLPRLLAPRRRRRGQRAPRPPRPHGLPRRRRALDAAQAAPRRGRRGRRRVL